MTRPRRARFGTFQADDVRRLQQLCGGPLQPDQTMMMPGRQSEYFPRLSTPEHDA